MPSVWKTLRSKVSAGPPTGFFVIPGSIVGPDDQIAPPKAAVKLDYEAEVAVILGSGGRNLDAKDVEIWGYTGWNDLSIRDPHHGGNVCGPSVAVGEPTDLSVLGMVSRVNGGQRQNGSTAQMIRSFAELAAYISQFLPLAPGDMITSGTPGGTAIEQGIDGSFLKAGDIVEVEIEGVGVLRNEIFTGV